MSGIYIPGLSMPRKTEIVSIVLSGDGSALLCEDGAYSEIKVIPVPEHGRLIDAGFLLSEYDKIHVGKPGGARLLIANAPTIIPKSGGTEDE